VTLRVNMGPPPAREVPMTCASPGSGRETFTVRGTTILERARISLMMRRTLGSGAPRRNNNSWYSLKSGSDVIHVHSPISHRRNKVVSMGSVGDIGRAKAPAPLITISVSTTTSGGRGRDGDMYFTRCSLLASTIGSNIFSDRFLI